MSRVWARFGTDSYMIVHALFTRDFYLTSSGSLGRSNLFKVGQLMDCLTISKSSPLCDFGPKPTMRSGTCVAVRYGFLGVD